MTKSEAKTIIEMLCQEYGNEKSLSESVDRIYEIIDMIDEPRDTISYPIYPEPNRITFPYVNNDLWTCSTSVNPKTELRG